MRRRRAAVVLVGGTIILALLAGAMPSMIEKSLPKTSVTDVVQNNLSVDTSTDAHNALTTLEALEVKGRAPKTGYDRTQFGNGWGKVEGCSTRDIILYRDLKNPLLDGECTVVSGILADPYSGNEIIFTKDKSTDVQIDHVVALSDAWQKGAQNLTIQERMKLANDPLELLAVSGSENQNKSDGDAATWLPSNKNFRCEYVARQIQVKKKYSLWVTEPEKKAMQTILQGCVAS